ncbi:MAG: DUF4175 family protein [Paracoccus sp. (in: a-proteobacteria)]|nr:DUF4175 family protein [Paracoccus sp. (in: a-proteobacteria)]
MTDDVKDDPRLGRALRLTALGLWWESVARAFWPVAVVFGLTLAALSLGLITALPQAARLAVLAVLALLLIVAGAAGLWRWRRPDAHAAERRLDASLPGRPISALRDRPALGNDGALWQAHRAQMAIRAGAARPVAPDAQLARRDPFALRLVALTAVAMAVLFGSTGQLGQGLAALAPQRSHVLPGEAARQDGLGWEGWADPPAYTRKPTIYLNALPDPATLELPQGSIISLRLYGEGGAVTQTIGTALPDEDARAPKYRVERDGVLDVAGRRITMTVRPDAPPAISLGPAAERRADGRLIQPFAAHDDFGVTEGHAEITLDLAAVSRSFGLETPPEPREPLQIRLPLGNAARPEIAGQITADLKKHPWANLPVRIRLHARDGIGQAAQSDELAMELPGRRFFDPFAAALIELRRDLLWSRANAGHAAELLRAITWQPEGFADPPVTDNLRAVIAGLESGALDEARRDALAEALWQTAVQLEDGGLSDALERMRRAQERLAQAMRRGASADEIRQLMDELRRATDEYTRMLAERGGDPSDRFNRAPVQMMSGDQIQQMMDDIQRLMNEGRMAEAQALLDQFSRMMENMQVRQAEGEGGSADGSAGRLTDTLREQQELADRAFRQAQDEWMGSNPYDQATPQDDSAEGEDGSPQDLADAQSMLRDDLAMQRSLLPERGTPQGEAAAEAMDRAGQAMREAEEALRDGDTTHALDRQAEAIEALREGVRALDRGQRGQQGQSAESGQQGQDGEGPQGEAGTMGGDRRGTNLPQRDPLGRALPGTGGGFSTDAPLDGDGGGDDRARDLQDEIRRRLGERSRPEAERDYLDRLIDRF